MLLKIGIQIAIFGKLCHNHEVLGIVHETVHLERALMLRFTKCEHFIQQLLLDKGVLVHLHFWNEFYGARSVTLLVRSEEHLARAALAYLSAEVEYILDPVYSGQARDGSEQLLVEV